jgi:hypothetical protein
MKHKIFKADRDEEAKHFTIFYKGKKITTATELKCLIIPNETQFWEWQNSNNLGCSSSTHSRRFGRNEF